MCLTKYYPDEPSHKKNGLYTLDNKGFPEPPNPRTQKTHTLKQVIEIIL